MTSSFLALYLQVNLLLAAAWLVWRFTRVVAKTFQIEVSQQCQLIVARYVFTGVLLSVPLLLISKLFPAEWLADFSAGISASWFTPDFVVVADLDHGLENRYAFGNIQLNLAALFTIALLAGFAWQIRSLVIALRNLQNVVLDATEWKRLHGIHFLFSQRISSPFSTRALGRKHVVLPSSLLLSPRNLRLAVTHELQHLRNGDLGWVILLELVKRLCFWNPAAHVWQYEFDNLQELACDEVLVQEKRVSALAYGNCLLEVASANTGQHLIAASSMVPKLSWSRNNHSQLKRRILMLDKRGSNKHTFLKLAGYAVLLGAGIFNAAFVVFAAEQGTPAAGAERKDYIPISRVNPQYPASAIEQKQVGWVQIEFAIATDGSVQDAVVLDHCVRLQAAAPESCTPDPLFDAESLAALSQWKYEPVVENGAAVKREGVQTILRYELGD
ncbi:MAG: M56 family metallopeptidase [Pseudomonadota bacterium]